MPVNNRRLRRSHELPAVIYLYKQETAEGVENYTLTRSLPRTQSSLLKTQTKAGLYKIIHKLSKTLPSISNNQHARIPFTHSISRTIDSPIGFCMSSGRTPHVYVSTSRQGAKGDFLWMFNVLIIAFCVESSKP